MSRFGTVAQQYFDSSGKPLASGKLYFYDPGTTDSKTVYSDSAETTPITQPVTLNGSGYQPDIFFSGQAKVVLQDSDSVQIDVADPVGEQPAEVFPAWDSATSYAANALIQGSDGLLYTSIGGSNLNNDPTSTTGFWNRYISVIDYDASATYNDGNIVRYNASLWECVTDSTSGVTPAVAASQWNLLGMPPAGGTFTGATTHDAGITTTTLAMTGALTGATSLGTAAVALTGKFTDAVYTITDGASVDIDPANGRVQLWTLGAARTPTESLAAGESVLLMIDDGTANTITWTHVDEWIGGSAPTLATTGYNVIALWKVATTTYGSFIGELS